MQLTENELETVARILVNNISREAIESEWKRWDENWTNETFYTKPSTYYVIKRAYEITQYE